MNLCPLASTLTVIQAQVMLILDILDPFIRIAQTKADYPFCPLALLMDHMAHGMAVILMLQAMRLIPSLWPQINNQMNNQCIGQVELLLETKILILTI